MTRDILVYLGLGSNLGNRLDFLNQACRELSAVTFCDFRTSAIYESEPLLKMKQPKYYNQVVCGLTDLSPVELVVKCQQIENMLGRVRNLIILLCDLRHLPPCLKILSRPRFLHTVLKCD